MSGQDRSRRHVGSGPWARDLDTDLDAIQRWGATVVVSLITDGEFDPLSVRDLPGAVRDRHMEWWHVPIPHGRPPGPDFEDAWAFAGAAVRDRLRTSDSHIRWYAEGEAEHLPAVAESSGYREDASEVEKEAARARVLANNQAVEKLLEEKGFVVTDQAHPSAQVSRYLQTRPDADDDSR